MLKNLLRIPNTFDTDDYRRVNVYCFHPIMILQT